MQDALLNFVQLTRKNKFGQLYLGKEYSRQKGGSVVKMEDDDILIQSNISW